MTDQDKKRFAILMNGLGAAFRCDVSKETMAIYFNYLTVFSIEAVVYAVDKVIETGERFPVVAKLREFANSYRKPINCQVPTVTAIEEFSQEEIERCKDMSFEDIVKMASEGV